MGTSTPRSSSSCRRKSARCRSRILQPQQIVIPPFLLRCLGYIPPNVPSTSLITRFLLATCPWNEGNKKQGRNFLWWGVSPDFSDVGLDVLGVSSSLALVSQISETTVSGSTYILIETEFHYVALTVMECDWPISHRDLPVCVS